jgi:hypothetical protein
LIRRAASAVRQILVSVVPVILGRVALVDLQTLAPVARVVPADLTLLVVSTVRQTLPRVASVGRQILVPVARVAPAGLPTQQALRVPVGLIRRAALAALRTLVQDRAVLLTRQALQVPAGLIRTWEDQLRNPAL